MDFFSPMSGDADEMGSVPANEAARDVADGASVLAAWLMLRDAADVRAYLAVHSDQLRQPASIARLTRWAAHAPSALAHEWAVRLVLLGAA